MRKPVSKGLATLFAAAAALILTLTLGAAGAQAHSSGHGSKNCGSAYYVVTRTKSAGDTWHYRVVTGTPFSKKFDNVSASNPWREWSGPIWSSYIDDWGATAQVLESHTAVCYQRPV
jgi:hypothetical protein